MRVIYVYLIFVMLSFVACKSTKQLSADPAQTEALKQQIDLMIQSLNQPDFDQLAELYTEDFSGISPAVTFESRAELIDALRENHKRSPSYIEADKIEVHTGVLIGYALLQWRIYNFNPTDNSKQIIFNKPVLQIWQRDKKQDWQLSRVLFYQADRPLGELKID